MNKNLKIITPMLIIVAAVAGATYIARSRKAPETTETKQAALLVHVIRPRIADGPFLIHAQGPVTPRNETALVAEAQQAAVAQAERNIERTRIRIPFHGVIRERTINLSQYVSVGARLNFDRPVTLTGSFAGQASRWHTPKPYFSGVFP